MMVEAGDRARGVLLDAKNAIQRSNGILLIL